MNKREQAVTEYLPPATPPMDAGAEFARNKPVFWKRGSSADRNATVPWPAERPRLPIKAVLFLLAAMMTFQFAHGQGIIGGTTPTTTTSLNGACQIPPNDSAEVGNAFLSYPSTNNPVGNTVISCTVTLPTPFSATSAGIYGPATQGHTNNLLFDLGPSRLGTNSITLIGWPPPTNPPPIFTNIYMVYSNSCTITAQQMADFNSGSWYVSVTSSNYPAGEIRGQFNAGPWLCQPTIATNGSIAFTVIGLQALTYEVDVSSDLLNWQAFTNMNEANGMLQVSDPNAIGPNRFYRVKSVPVIYWPPGSNFIWQTPGVPF